MGGVRWGGVGGAPMVGDGGLGGGELRADSALKRGRPGPEERVREGEESRGPAVKRSAEMSRGREMSRVPNHVSKVHFRGICAVDWDVVWSIEIHAPFHCWTVRFWLCRSSESTRSEEDEGFWSGPWFSP